MFRLTPVYRTADHEEIQYQGLLRLRRFEDTVQAACATTSLDLELVHGG